MSHISVVTDYLFTNDGDYDKEDKKYDEEDKCISVMRLMVVITQLTVGG